MTQYLLSVHSVEGAPTPPAEEILNAYQRVAAFNAELQAAGAWVFAGGLHPPSTATVVRAQPGAQPGHGEVLITDGPFVEGKEHVGGVWVIAVADLDAALAWAVKASAACGNPVEVRPFQEPSEDQAPED
jgi:hypothetical protein